MIIRYEIIKKPIIFIIKKRWIFGELDVFSSKLSVYFLYSQEITNWIRSIEFTIFWGHQTREFWIDLKSNFFGKT